MSFTTDLFYAWRALRHRPSSSVMAVAALALAIGATTATFSLFSALLLRPLPYPDPDRLVAIWNRYGDSSRDVWLAPPELEDLAREVTAFDRVGGLMDVSYTLIGRGNAERVAGLAVTPAVLDMLGARPQLGRIFAREEDASSAPATVLVSHDLWTRRLGQRADIVGQLLRLDGRSYEVIGVLPASFGLSPLSSVMPSKVDVWVPLGPEIPPGFRDNRTINVLHVLGRLRPGVPLARAQADVAALTTRTTLDYPSAYAATARRSHVVLLHAQLAEPVRAALWLLMGAVALVMTIAIANVSSLLVGAAMARRSEIAVRAALGASQPRIIRQFVLESLLLALTGGACGLLLARWTLPLLLRWSAGALPPSFAVGIDWRVVLFSIASTLAAAALSGLAPSWHASRQAAAAGLRQARTAGARHRPGARAFLVSGQVAMATMLLVVTGGLLARLADVLAAPPGFEPAHALTFRLSPPPGDRTPDRLVDLFDRAVARLRALPGVEAAGAVSHLPMSGAFLGSTFRAEAGMRARTEETFGADHRSATPGYRVAAGLQLVRGRWFDARDHRDGVAVAVVDEALAARIWPGEDAVGRRLRWMRANRVMEIVGVVRPVRHYGLAAPSRETVYRPHTQFTPPAVFVVVRTRGDLSALAAAVPSAVRSVDEDLAVSETAPFEALVARSAAQPVLQARLVGVFGLTALTLAALGLYALLAFIVSERTREIGLRAALGATRLRIVGGIVGETARLAGLGLGTGVAALLLAMPLLRGTLQLGLTLDAPIVLGTVIALGCAAGAASVGPAMRASRVDPAVALRKDT